MSYHPSKELDALMEKLLGQEKHRFFESVGEQFPHTIRFNPLKGPVDVLVQFLRDQGFEFEPFPGFTNVYRILFQPYPIGRSISHFLGHFYVQDISSMLPPMVLQPQPGELVLDMSAAPGSKTTQMAAIMENKGLILANDVVMKRLRALINNLQRMGIVNTAVVKNYGESFGKQYFEQFDKILLDPACSGLGTLHKSPEVLSWWTPNHCVRLASSQKQLIASAIQALKPGGTLVYSTCTLTPEENEAVVHDALSKYPVELVEFELPGLKTRPGLTRFEDQVFDRQLEKAQRLYPFENETEGFFLARLVKTDGMEQKKQFAKKIPVTSTFIPARKAPAKKFIDIFSQHFGISQDIFEKYRYYVDKNITAVTPELAEFVFKTVPLKSGLTIAHTMTHTAKLTTEGSHLLGSHAIKSYVDLPDLETLEKFVNREVLQTDEDGHFQTLVRYKNITIGYGLSDQGKLKSQFPKGDWPFRIIYEDKR